MLHNQVAFTFMVLISPNVLCNQCFLYLAPSLLPNFGYGVFAGSRFSENCTVENGPSVLFGENLFYNTQLENYLYSAHDPRFAVTVFGAGMMFNHLDIPNLYQDWDEEPIDVQVVNIRPYGTYNFKAYIASRDIENGEELFASYGKATWFSDRDIPYNSSVTANGLRHDTNYLQKYGHCLSNVFVGSSTVPVAGRGVFASRKFHDRELVTISPVLILPKHIIRREAASSLLLNYLMTREGSDVAVLPMGTAAFCNHARGGRVNLVAYWVSNLQGDIVEDLTNISDPEKVVDAKSPPLLLGYFATKEIEEGDELFVSYGWEWEVEWRRHLDLTELWFSLYSDDYNNASRSTSGDGRRVSRAPQFREPMQAPSHLFPKQWLNTSCLGRECYKTRLSRKQFYTDQATQRVLGMHHTRHRNFLTLQDLRASREATNKLRQQESLFSGLIKVIFELFIGIWHTVQYIRSS